MSQIVKQGYVKFQSKHLGVWKKRWLVLKSGSANGPVRLEKYKDESTALSAAGAERRIFDLTQMDDLFRMMDRPHGITISLSDGFETIQFCAESEMDAENWIKAIKEELNPSKRRNDQGRGGCGTDMFTVYLMANAKLDARGDCTMQITQDSVRLFDPRDNRRELASWPLKGLRRYGVERNMFTLEAGRSCPTGEGVFIFDTEYAEDIYHKVHDLTQALARIQRTGRSGR